MTLWQSLIVAIAAVAQTTAAAAAACPGPAPASNPQAANGVAFKVLQNGLARPRGIVMDSEGNLLVVEAGAKGVKRVVLDDADGLDVCVSSSAQLIDDGKVRCSPSSLPTPNYYYYYFFFFLQEEEILLLTSHPRSSTTVSPSPAMARRSLSRPTTAPTPTRTTPPRAPSATRGRLSAA